MTGSSSATTRTRPSVTGSSARTRPPVSGPSWPASASNAPATPNARAGTTRLRRTAATDLLVDADTQDRVQESVFFAAALGVYPHLNVMDAAFCVVHDGVQHNLRASRLLNMERMDTVVGPISVEVIEPLKSLRVRVDSSGPRINDGLWHFVGVVYTRSGNGVIYVDGTPATGGACEDCLVPKPVLRDIAVQMLDKQGIGGEAADVELTYPADK